MNSVSWTVTCLSTKHFQANIWWPFFSGPAINVCDLLSFFSAVFSNVDLDSNPFESDSEREQLEAEWSDDDLIDESKIIENRIIINSNSQVHTTVS